MLTLHYCPATVSQQLPFSLEINAIEMHASNFDFQTNDSLQQKENRKEEDSKVKYSSFKDPMPPSPNDRPAFS